MGTALFPFCPLFQVFLHPQHFALHLVQPDVKLLFQTFDEIRGGYKAHPRGCFNHRVFSVLLSSLCGLIHALSVLSMGCFPNNLIYNKVKDTLPISIVLLVRSLYFLHTRKTFFKS